MSRNRNVATLVVVALLAGVGIYAVYDQILRGDSAPTLALPTAEPSAGAGGPSAAAATLTVADAAGSWSIASGAQVGYRVREQLANLPAESDAVGRTDQVSGSATIAAAGGSVRVTEATIDVDTTTITSDKSMRDNRLRTEGLQTDQFRTASFKLTGAVDVPEAAFDGTTVDVTLRGDLTLHGVTRTVDIPAKAQVIGNQISVSGSLTFPLSDYDIVAPSIGGFIVSIADTGTLEFLVTFAKA